MRKANAIDLLKRTLIILAAILILGIGASLAEASTLLFVDLNGNSGEIAAAKRAAARRGEKFVTLPGEEDSALYERTRIELDRACQRFGKSSAECDVQVNEAEALRTRLGYDLRDELDRLEEKLSENNEKVTTFVVSGHHALDLPMYGDLSRQDIGLSDLAAFMASHPLFSELETVGLWSCRTLFHEEEDVRMWLSLLPQVKVIAGYSGRSPLGIRGSTAAYLESFLSQTASLRSSSSPADFRSRVTAIRQAQADSTAIFARGLSDQGYLWVNPSSEDVRENGVKPGARVRRIP